MWITFGLLRCFLSAFVALILVAPIHCRGSNGEQVVYCKGTCTLSLKFVYAFVVFFIFVILSYQNACYGCENAENQTWSDLFYDRWKFQRQCVNVTDTTWGRIYFSTCEYFGLSPNLFWSRTTLCITCMEQTLQSKSKNSAVVHRSPHDRQTKSNLDSNTVFWRT